jgi:hypothetical protein
LPRKWSSMPRVLHECAWFRLANSRRHAGQVQSGSALRVTRAVISFLARAAWPVTDMSIRRRSTSVNRSPPPTVDARCLPEGAAHERWGSALTLRRNSRYSRVLLEEFPPTHRQRLAETATPDGWRRFHSRRSERGNGLDDDPDQGPAHAGGVAARTHGHRGRGLPARGLRPARRPRRRVVHPRAPLHPCQEPRRRAIPRPLRRGPARLSRRRPRGPARRSRRRGSLAHAPRPPGATIEDRPRRGVAGFQLLDPRGRSRKGDRHAELAARRVRFRRAADRGGEVSSQVGIRIPAPLRPLTGGR